jgi:hypothetical protein
LNFEEVSAQRAIERPFISPGYIGALFGFRWKVGVYP